MIMTLKDTFEVYYDPNLNGIKEEKWHEEQGLLNHMIFIVLNAVIKEFPVSGEEVINTAEVI